MEEGRSPLETREAQNEGNTQRPGPAWRSWALSIFVAILLSAAATFLLGGGFPFGPDGAREGCCDRHPACCPDGAEGVRGQR